MNRLFQLRRKSTSSSAYILRSLKRPGELRYLREVYGKAFFAISAQAPRALRIDRLAEKLASSGRLDLDAAKAKAATLCSREQDEIDQVCGQSVRRSFVMSDYFIDASGTIESIDGQMRRLVRLLFGHPFETPTRDEQGMAMAFLASFRSAHWSRQVGAAIATADGSLVATGTNEVPSPAGGAYWHNDLSDARDFQLKKNTSFEVRQEVLGDLIERIYKLEWLSEDIVAELGSDQFVEQAAREHLREARLMDALEYDRSVHAEMLAITDAARRGISLAGSTLYTTTFPCHNCARHIIAAGIRRVVFLFPYDKSLAERLHGDAIGVDLSSSLGTGVVRFDPYVGIAPNHYMNMFAMPERKGMGKHWKRTAEWPHTKPTPRLWANETGISKRELREASTFVDDLRELGFKRQRSERSRTNDKEKEHKRQGRRPGRLGGVARADTRGPREGNDKLGSRVPALRA